MTLQQSFDFSGRTVLVTGGSSGIGNAIAQLFLSLGAVVNVWGSRASVEDYSKDDGSNLDGLLYSRVDLSDLDAVAAAPLPGHKLDVLVVSQGICGWEKESDPAEFRRVVDTNLNGVMGTCTRCYEALKAAKGKVILINSVSGLKSSAGIPAYSASKAGLTSLTESLAQSWAPDGIRVNGVAPGIVPTKLTKKALSQPGRIEVNLKRIPLGRLGSTADIAGIAVFLASGLSDFILGQTIVADGGMTLT